LQRQNLQLRQQNLSTPDPLINYSPTTINNEECPICFNPLNNNMPLLKHLCGKIFHKTCLETWLNTPLEDGENIIRKCPMCRGFGSKKTKKTKKRSVKKISKL